MKALDKSVSRSPKIWSLYADLFHSMSSIAKKHFFDFSKSTLVFLEDFFKKVGILPFLNSWTCLFYITLTKLVKYLHAHSYLLYILPFIIDRRNAHCLISAIIYYQHLNISMLAIEGIHSDIKVTYNTKRNCIMVYFSEFFKNKKLGIFMVF